MRYLIWNNKGGVGKSFLTFCLAAEYAAKHPDIPTAVVDMCPQANVSEIILGGNGLGEDNLTKCYEDGMTIANYIKSRYSNRLGKIGTELAYFVKAAGYNSSMPENLYLLPGDTDLDICAAIINYLASAPEKMAWENTYKILIDVIGAFEQHHKNKAVVFIDSNPSFANYTQLALIASQRLIVPCTADSASIRGVYNVLRLIYGIRTGKNLSDENVFDTFYDKVNQLNIPMPKIHAFILNKSRTHNRDASAAYDAHVSHIEKMTATLAEQYADNFTENDGTIQTDGLKRTFKVKDGNTLSAVLNYNGDAPSRLQHRKYIVYGKKTQVNREQIDTFLEDIHQITDVL